MKQQKKRTLKKKKMKYRKKTGREDAFILGIGDIDNKKAIYGFMNFNFMGGSMGRAVGEGIVRGAQKAIENKYPYIIFTSSLINFFNCDLVIFISCFSY